MRIKEKFADINTLKTTSFTLGLLTCWFFTHPYLGILDDGLLYAVQALSRLYPEAYKNDIFIQYGFQGSYTIFNPLYSFAINYLGLNKATITLTLMGYALWLSASFYIARILMPEKSLWVFLTLLFTLPGNYGYEGIFSYGEPILTPRIFSEALTIYSIAFFIQKRLPLSIAFLSAALIMHPLMAGCGLVFLIIYNQKFKLKNVFSTLLIILSILLVLAAARIGPFANLFRVMDDHWYQLIYQRNSHVFIGAWGIKTINSVIFDCSIILSSLIVFSGQQRRVLFSSLLTGLLCLMVSWFGADLFHNIFMIQVQLWRAFWLMQWFVYLAIALFIVDWGNNSDVLKMTCLLYLSAWFALDHAGGILALIICLLFYLNYKRNKDIVIPRAARIFAYLLPVILGSVWLLLQIQGIIASPSNGDKLLFGNFIYLFLLKTRIFIIIACLFFWKLLPGVKNKTPAMAIVLMMLIIFSIIIQAWDIRPPLKKLRENDHFLSEKPFKNKVPLDSVVYWQDSVESTWLTLGRSSYASFHQGATMPFSRKMALKLEDRLNRLKVFKVKDSIISRKERDNADHFSPNLKVKGLVHVCQDSELDFVVLSSKFSDGLIDEYSDKENDVVYYLYDCKFYRENFHPK